MQVKELSDITGVNIETIRSYRKVGYLRPVQKANGYYDYDMESLITLIWIRKLRGYTMSLNEIYNYFFSQDPEELITILNQRKEYIESEIIERQLAVRYIDLETRHIRETAKGTLGAQMFQSIDDKIDVYSLENRSERFKKLQFSLTPTVFIPKEVLNGPISRDKIPVKIGIGTYQYILDERGIKRPKDAVIVPNGLNITQLLILRNFTEISVEELAPMMTYAKANGLTFQSDTTGYLMRIEIIDQKPVFHFRIRACVQQNSIRDPLIKNRKRK